MKAMQITRHAPIEEAPLTPAELPVPEPGKGELLVKVEVCGVCHTDLHEVEGEIHPPRLPVTPGHQVVGTVVRLGAETEGFQVGDRVGAAWLRSSCGDCPYCKKGMENLCTRGMFNGFSTDGGYAEYMTLPAFFAYTIPKDFPSDQAAPLLCGGIIGYRALRLSNIRPGQRLGLYGFGNSAHIAIQVARYWNCEVYVFSRSEEHLEFARRLGAAWTGRAEDGAPHLLDAAVIFAPAGKLVPLALEALDKGGTLALAGIYMSDIPPLRYESHLYYEKTLRSVANSTRRDGQELLDLAARIPIRTTVHSYPLSAANQALLDVKNSRFSGGAILVME